VAKMRTRVIGERCCVSANGTCVSILGRARSARFSLVNSVPVGLYRRFSGQPCADMEHAPEMTIWPAFGQIFSNTLSIKRLRRTPMTGPCLAPPGGVDPCFKPAVDVA